MYELITAALAQKKIEKLVKFPVELRSKAENEIVKWISTYHAVYDEPPTIERVMEEFDNFVPIFPKTPRPIEDVFDTTLNEKRLELTQRILNEAILEAEGGAIPTTLLNRLQSSLSITGNEIQVYSEFDRDFYFRENEKLPIGFPTIDKATGGLSTGDFFVIAARLGSGKTTISLFVANRWFKKGKRVLFISLEMNFEDIFARLDAMMGHFNPLKLRSPDEEMRTMISSVVIPEVKKWPGEIFVPTGRIASPADIQGLIKDMRIDACIVDGIYLMRSNTSPGAQKWEKVAAISNELKQVALTTGVPIVGITQLNRSTDPGKPDISNLSYSDAIAQDADFVMYCMPTEEDKATISLELMKNRYGECTSTEVTIDFDRMRLIDNSAAAASRS